MIRDMTHGLSCIRDVTCALPYTRDRDMTHGLSCVRDVTYVSLSPSSGMLLSLVLGTDKR